MVNKMGRQGGNAIPRNGNEKGLKILGIIDKVVLRDNIHQRSYREIAASGSMSCSPWDDHVKGPYSFFLCICVREPLTRL